MILGLIKGKEIINQKKTNNDLEIITIKIKEELLFKQLMKQIELNYNKKDGYIGLSVKLPEALAAAQLVKEVQSLLQKSIIQFKIEKASKSIKIY